MTALPDPNPFQRAPVEFQPVLFRVERCEYVPADLLLRVSVRVARELSSQTPAMLIVEREAVEYSCAPLLSCATPAPLTDSSEWLWRGAFALAPELGCDPRAELRLRLRDDLLLALPRPSERGFLTAGSSGRGERPRAWPYVLRASSLRKSALLLAAACQLCLVSPWSAGALADGSAPTGTSSEPAPEAPSTPPAGGSGEPAPETPSTPPAGGSGSTPETPTPPAGGSGSAPETPATPPSGGSGSAPQAPAKELRTVQPSAPTSTTLTPSRAPSGATAPAGTSVATRPGASSPMVLVQHPQKPSAPRNGKAGGAPASGKTETKSKKAATPSTTQANNNVALAPQLIAAETGALAAALEASAASDQALAFYRIPLFLLPIYQSAAAQYDVPWQILAAINEIETDYGSDQSVSSAGAVGWMQFMPSTWLQYGVDALNAGYADPYNPVDAIFAAARYLRAAGAPANLTSAILAYNHSQEYLSSVLLRAKLITAYPQAVIDTLTGLIDARLPVTGKQFSFIAPKSSQTTSSATANAVPAAALPTTTPTTTPATTPPTTAPVSPAAAAAAATSNGRARPLQLVELMSAPNASVVAVSDGRILKLGASRKLGRYVILRDIYGDVFTYAGLGSIAHTYTPPKTKPTPVTAPSAALSNAHGAGTSEGVGTGTPAPADLGKVRLFAHPQDAVAAAPPPGAARARSRSSATHRLALRAGSVVAQGTVLGRVRVPPGDRDGHLRFAIRPAGDPATIDPAPILQNWVQLHAALHPQGAKGEPHLLGAVAKPRPSAKVAGAARAPAGAAHSAGAGRTAPSPLLLGEQLSSAQWDRLIARIGALPMPTVAVKPSSSAVPDP